METAGLAHVIGRNARRIRAEAGATLEDVAQSARGYGLKGWGGGRVSDLEHGRVSPTLPTLVALCLTLGDVRKSPLTLAELVEHQGEVEITSTLAIRSTALMRFLDGQPVKLTKRDVPALPDISAAEISAGMRRLTENMPPSLRDVSLATTIAVGNRSGEAEQRLARRLDVSPFTLSAASAYLYNGLTASEERDRRAGPEASAQKRGRISREIQTELKAILDAQQEPTNEELT